MSKWIDADALLKNVDKYPYAQGLMDLIADIQTAPSINIVRCDECQYYEDGHCESAEMWQSINGYTTECESMSRNADDFCSYGQKERASDDTRKRT